MVATDGLAAWAGVRRFGSRFRFVHRKLIRQPHFARQSFLL